MASSSETSKRPLPLRFVGAFVARPRLLGALAMGLVAFGGLTFVHEFRWVTRAILSWNVVCLTFIATIVWFMRHTSEADMREHAATQDEGQGVILTVAMAAATASIAAVAAELMVAKNAPGWEGPARVLLACLTVAASWAFLHFIFALHYAHEYYGPDDDPKKTERGGLQFPGDEAPDYWDFLHFAIVIGVASQTADVAFTSKTLRRVGGVHGVISFVFNTGVLALAINGVAGLFT